MSEPIASVPSATATTVTALFDCCRKLCAKPGYFRLVVCLLGIRQQPFKSVDALLKVDALFEIHFKSSIAGFTIASVFSSLFPP